MELEILYQDAQLVAINKPAGLLVHRSPIDRHETRFALQIVRNQIGQRVFPVHRLDKPTSGILVFGLQAEVAHALQQQMQLGEVSKTYQAIVRGHTPESLLIDHPVKAIDDKYDFEANDTAKEAQTRLRTIARCELPIGIDKYPSSRYSLVELLPVTGRRHQLRYHMKHISHPIIGDAKYGKGNHNRFFQQAFGCNRLLLAATSLSFRHPLTGKPVNIKASLDSSFNQILETLPWQHLDAADNLNHAH